MAIDIKISNSTSNTSKNLQNNLKQTKDTVSINSKNLALSNTNQPSVIQKTSNSAFNKIYLEKLDGDLKEILTKLKSLGQQFFRSPSIETLNEFKEGIKFFLKRVSKELFKLKEEFGPKRENKQKVYHLIETVDEETNKLTFQTLSSEKAIILLSTLDEIRGLVIDLFT